MAHPPSTVTVLPARCGHKTPPQSATPSERGGGGRRGGSSATRPSRTLAFALSRFLGGERRQRWRADRSKRQPVAAVVTHCARADGVSLALVSVRQQSTRALPAVRRRREVASTQGWRYVRRGRQPSGPWRAIHHAPRPAVRSRRTRSGGGRHGGVVAPPRRAPLWTGGEQKLARACASIILSFRSLRAHLWVRRSASPVLGEFCVNKPQHRQAIFT